MLRSGTAWVDLPVRFVESNSVRKRFRRLARKGVWKRVFQALQDPAFD